MTDEIGTLRDVLGELDRLPWSTLRTAHGTAERVPEAIRGLVSSEAGNVADWYWRLDNVVVLQGSVYEAAYYVIPALMAIVDSQLPAANRAAAYDVLIEIARGVAGDKDRATIGTVPLVEACKELINQGFERYRADLLGSDPLLRWKALDLVTSLDAPQPQLLALLQSVRAGDDSEFSEALDREIADLRS